MQVDFSEESSISSKQIELMEKLLQDTRSSSAKQIEDSTLHAAAKLVNQMKEEELHFTSYLHYPTLVKEENGRRHEEFIAEMQAQYAEILRHRIEQIKVESSNEIEEMRASERNLRLMLEDKMNSLQKDYIPCTSHEDILAEKNLAYENL